MMSHVNLRSFQILALLHPAFNDDDLEAPNSPLHPQLSAAIMFSSRAILRATQAASPARVSVSRAIASTQARTYATPATADAKPPKALYGLDGTYASALVRQLQKNQLRLVADELCDRLAGRYAVWRRI